MSHRALFVALILFCLAAPYRAAAQGDGTSNTPGGVTIHVVQRGETLFHIAMEYGTTVDAIADANGITNSEVITVGQRLLIPGAQTNMPGAPVTVIVHPGDSLNTLVRSYHTTADSLAASNFITNPYQLYVGEELTISQGSAEVSLDAPGLLIHALPGENWFRLSLRYGVTLDSLFEANQLTRLMPIFAGERLWIPVTDASSPVDLPLPFQSCLVTPIPAVQGQTVSLHLTTSEPVALSGTLMGYPLNIATENGADYYALFGIHAFTASG
ncbi:MAG TPA: LysM peptidoglycan-binding domain-containing protein, partial [Aggregatilineaceae bacterium]|nr:LysM peptidoglycan-binding domain-containing protein [Aggregatilineaceae bacterium]